MNREAVALDVGGTHLRAARADIRGGIVGTPTRVHADFSRLQGTRDAVLERVIEQIAQLVAPLCAGGVPVGIGFPGYVSDGVVLGAPNIPALVEVPLEALLAKRLKTEVRIENDANCAALGEWRFGAGARAPSLLHLTLGTGVGGGWVRDGRIERGSHGMALEIGHLRIDWRDDAPPCGCGARGCLEQFASASAVARHYGETGIDAREVYRRAQVGDARARRVLHQAGEALGGAIAQAVKLLDLRTVTVSGGLTGAWDYLQPALAAALDANLIPPHRGKVVVRRSTLDDTAGLLGAAALVL